MPNCLRLLVHCDLREASRADWTAGKSKAISKAIQDLQTLLIGKEAELQAHLKALIARSKG